MIDTKMNASYVILCFFCFSVLTLFMFFCSLPSDNSLLLLALYSLALKFLLPS